MLTVDRCDSSGSARQLFSDAAGWLPGQSGRGRTAARSDDGGESSDRASGSVVDIRGQQTML
jgi:hypothetical protein